MNVNFNGFNMGQNPFEEIQRTCANHFACVNCPVYDNYGAHLEDNSVTMCEKVMERIVKEQRNNAKV